MNTKRMLIVAFLVVLLITSLISIAENSKKISIFGFKSEVSGVKLMVDTELARLRGGEQFMPLLVWLGHSEKKSIVVKRESFTLVDPEGNVNPLPSYEEVVKQYGASLIGFDYKILRNKDDYGKMDFLSCRRIGQVSFFPNPSSPGVLYDNVELPNRSYFRTLLYFPNKAARPEGQYRLSFKEHEKDLVIEVPFDVKWMR